MSCVDGGGVVEMSNDGGASGGDDDDDDDDDDGCFSSLTDVDVVLRDVAESEGG